MTSIVKRVKDRQNLKEMLLRSIENSVKLYTDKSHFIYELLQNAEDTGATKVIFKQYDDRLEFYHNGLPFTESNLESICNIALSDKVQDLNKIGEFGVGFKSVFSICKKVLLYSIPDQEQINSGLYTPISVEINDFTDPKEIKSIALNDDFKTKFVFPYDLAFSSFNSIDDLKEAVSNKLKNLGITTLLFMNSLKSIEYKIVLSHETKSGVYKLDVKSLNNFCNLVKTYQKENSTTNINDDNITDKTKNNKKKAEDTYAYLIFNQKADCNKLNRALNIAFYVRIDENNNYNFMKAELPFISVFFPTNQESKLDFIVQAPFRTTPSRDYIPYDNKENQRLVLGLAKLIKRSILSLRDMGLVNLSFLKIMPFDEDDFKLNALLKPIYDSVLDTFKEEAVIPSNNGNYVCGDNALLARGQEQISVFSDEDITDLIKDGKEHFWLSAKITDTNEYSNVHSYFVNKLYIENIVPYKILNYIESNPDFLPSVTNDWLIRFYQLLENQAQLFDRKLNNRNEKSCVKIVKTNDGRFVSPCIQEGIGFEAKLKNNVFSPDETAIAAGLNVVNKNLYENCKNFFDNILHIPVVDEFECFDKYLNCKYIDCNYEFDEQYIEDIKKIIKYLNSLEYNDYNIFVKKLNNLYLLKCEDYSGNDVKLKPHIKLKSWSRWYDGYSSTSGVTVFTPKTTSGLSIKGYLKSMILEDDNYYFIDYDFYEKNNITFENLAKFGVSNSVLIGDKTTHCEGYHCVGMKQKYYVCDVVGDFRYFFSIDKIRFCLFIISNYKNFKDSDELDELDAKVKSCFILKTLKENANCLKGQIYVPKAKQHFEEVADVVRFLRKEERTHKIDLNNNEKLENSMFNKWDQKWLFNKNDELVAPWQISVDELSKEVYGEITLPSDLKQLLGFKESVIDCYNKSKALVENMSEFEQEQLFQVLLDLRHSCSYNRHSSNNFNIDFGFPIYKVKNFENLRRHVEQMFAYASPVVYEEKIRSIRTSHRSEDIRAYLRDMYCNENGNLYFCQICHKSINNFKACQIEDKPKMELEPMNLCLCSECHETYSQIRNKKTKIEQFIDTLSNIELEAEASEPVKIKLNDNEIWFTHTHALEIRELLRLTRSI